MTSTIPNANQLKKFIIRGHSTAKYGPVDLYVGEADGEQWATNKYWITRAARIAPLLAEYNLSADVPGAYAVNGKVSPSGKQVPNMGAFLHDGFDLPSTRVLLADRPAYVTDYSGTLMAVYQLADGTMAGLISGEADWLAAWTGDEVPADHRVDGVRVMFRHAKEDGLMAAFIADTTHVIERQTHGTGHGTGTPEVSEPGAPIVLAIAMATKYK
jgi:hypothetical protein